MCRTWPTALRSDFECLRVFSKRRSSVSERCLAGAFSKATIPSELRIDRVEGEGGGDSGPGGRCHDDDMGMDRWSAANDE